MTEDPTRKRDDGVNPDEDATGEMPLAESGAPEVQDQAAELSAEDIAEQEKQGVFDSYVDIWNQVISLGLERGVSQGDVLAAIESEGSSDLYDVQQVKKIMMSENFLGRRDQFREKFNHNSHAEMAVKYAAFKEFAPVGSPRRELFATYDVTDGEVRVAWNQKREQYEICAIDGKDDSDEGQFARASTIPEIAKMAFDHAVDVGEKGGGTNVEGFIKSAQTYRDEIRDGVGFEGENARMTVENYDRMINKMYKLEAAGKITTEKFGTEVPPEIRQVAEEKRTQIIEEWKQQLAELQRKDQIDKIKKTIEAI